MPASGPDVGVQGLQQQERAPRHRGEQGCIAAWEQGKEEGGETSRLWKEEVLGRNLSEAEAQLLTESQV